jgi:presequence protease
MDTMPTTPQTVLQPNDTLDGFRVQAVEAIPELRAVAYLLQHAGCGARVLHLHSDDEENLFSISFPTPPPDDTGMPHILEHAVLAGSRKYPVREPFFEMIKMSMATFINAMTGSDCTYYPVMSNVQQDLFNLAEVYFDAVFHPLLTEMTFRREGHHLAPADPRAPTGELTVSGIVYNEMKGAYSDAEMLLFRSISRDLMPDTIYARDSGGDPAAIPNLTHQTLVDFHRTHYHPGNARFCFYGNIPTREYTAFLKDKLAPFARRDVAPVLSRQPRWNQPRAATRMYPVGATEPLTEKTYLGSFWLTGDALDPDHVAAMQVLSLILLGNDAAPLKQAIIDSQLGADLIHSGAHTEGPESVFGVVLKGSEADRAAAFTKLVAHTLAATADREFAPERVRAALRQATYRYAEILPMHPLHSLLRVLSAWTYGLSPLTFLGMRARLEACHARWEREPGFFNRIARECLVDNPHRLDIAFRPDRELAPREEALFAERMKALRATLTDSDVLRIGAEAAELDRLNSTPNSPESLAALPQLSVSDLPAKLGDIVTAVEQLDGASLLRNDIFANGVNYLVLHFDLQGLPADLWTYLPRYADAVRKCGAAGLDYGQMAQRVAATSGGIGCSPVFDTHRENAGLPIHGLRITMKALDDQIDDALGVLHDLLFAVDPRDRARLNDVLLQARAGYRTDFVNEGHTTARMHAARGFTEQSHLSELVGGLPQLGLTEALVSKFDDQAEPLMARIETLRDFLLERGRLTVGFTGSDAAAATLRATLTSWLGAMRDRRERDPATGFRPFATPPREGLAGPIQVAHCARVCPGLHYSAPAEAALAVAAHLVSLDYILSEIRFKGNAYGASFGNDASQALLRFGSFRDPQIANTLRVFDGLKDYVRSVQWSQTDIDRAIIALAKDELKPMRPGPATGLALHRRLAGQTLQVRQARYERLRAVTPTAARRALLDVLDAHLERSAICVVANRAKLEAANNQLSGPPLAIEEIIV